MLKYLFDILGKLLPSLFSSDGQFLTIEHSERTTRNGKEINKKVIIPKWVGLLLLVFVILCLSLYFT